MKNSLRNVTALCLCGGSLLFAGCGGGDGGGGGGSSRPQPTAEINRDNAGEVAEAATSGRVVVFAGEEREDDEQERAAHERFPPGIQSLDANLTEGAGSKRPLL